MALSKRLLNAALGSQTLFEAVRTPLSVDLGLYAVDPPNDYQS
jgi:hypothetical protein